MATGTPDGLPEWEAEFDRLACTVPPATMLVVAQVVYFRVDAFATRWANAPSTGCETARGSGAVRCAPEHDEWPRCARLR